MWGKFATCPYRANSKPAPTLSGLMEDHKPLVAFRRLVLDGPVRDVAGHPPLQCGQERLNLYGLPLCHHFDPAIAPVANRTGHCEALDQVAGRVAKTHALDLAGVED